MKLAFRVFVLSVVVAGAAAASVSSSSEAYAFEPSVGYCWTAGSDVRTRHGVHQHNEVASTPLSTKVLHGWF